MERKELIGALYHSWRQNHPEESQELAEKSDQMKAVIDDTESLFQPDEVFAAIDEVVYAAEKQGFEAGLSVGLRLCSVQEV